jgi:D-inositol-3-phosphate glycosyltransferase
MSNSPPLRVLMMTDSYPPAVSGIAHHVQDLARALAGIGVDVHVVKIGHAGGNADQEGLTVLGVEPPASVSAGSTDGPLSPPHVLHSNLAMIEHVLTITQSSSYDIVHVHDIFAAPAGITVANVLDLPLILTKHFCYPANEHRQSAGDILSYLMSLEDWSLGAADQVIAVSHELQQVIISRDPRLQGKCAVATSGTNIGAAQLDGDKSASRERLAARLGMKPPLGFVLLQVGRLVNVKGADISIHALATLMEQAPLSNCQLVLIGDGPAPIRQYLRGLASRVGVSNRVFFGGPEHSRDALADLYRAADAVVVPSRADSAPLVVAEAISLRSLVIAADAGGIPEQVVHMRNGLLFRHGPNPPASGRALADMVKWAVAHTTPAMHVAKFGPLHGEDTYSWPKLAGEVLRLYHRVMDQKASRMAGTHPRPCAG